ncbi:hypothetical protein DFH06DRAFT_111648 [Mycena polygramma]|nr:hypothetical protein DFH06DRAFT_111648 [Mycena polygramma]
MPPVQDPTTSSTSAGEASRLRRRPAVVLRAPTNGPMAIFCGASEPITSLNISEYEYDEHRPGIVQMLPEEYPPPLPRKRSYSGTTRTNGCGAQVHSAVMMMRRNPCWYGSQQGLADTVVPLERMYFPHDVAEVLGLRDKDQRLACECVLSGVGCAVCAGCISMVEGSLCR